MAVLKEENDLKNRQIGKSINCDQSLVVIRFLIGLGLREEVSVCFFRALSDGNC